MQDEQNSFIRMNLGGKKLGAKQADIKWLILMRKLWAIG